MKIKRSKIGIPAREALVKGADYMANAVKSTLGPFGVRFAIEKNEEITSDGVTVAREIASGCIQDELEARGARMLLKGIAQVEEEVFDGTTTAAAIGQETMKACIERLPSLGVLNAKGVGKLKSSEVEMKVKEEVREIVALLEARSVKIKDEKTLVKSALVSTGNQELADLIGKAQWELGPEGYIIAEETPNKFCSIERISGIKIDNGIVSSLAINNAEKQSLDLKDIPILLTNFIIKDLRPNILNFNTDTGKGTGIGNLMAEKGLNSLILVGRHFEQIAISQCMDNMKTGFSIYPINAPYVDQIQVMKDLAAVLGGRFIDTDSGSMDSIKLEDLGYISSFSGNRTNAIFCGRNDVKTKARVAIRINELEEQLKGALSPFERKLLEQRISQLKNGFAVLKVGAPIEGDRKYMKKRADDAVGAARLALKGGTVPGAGQALKDLADSLPDTYILKKPLESVYNLIMESAPEGFKIEKWVRDPFLGLKAIIEIMCPLGALIATAGGVIASENPKPIDTLLNAKRAVETVDATQ